MVKRWLAVCLMVMVVMPGVSALAEDEPELGALFDGIRERYGSLSGLTMPYTREVVTRSMSMLGTKGGGDTASGRIFFKAPHFLRMEQASPRVELLVTDGGTIWWYVPDERVVHRHSADRFGQELRLLNDIFQGLLTVEERFAVSYGGEEGGYEQIVLRPDPPWEEIDHVLISVSPDYRIRKVAIHNMLGSVTTFTLDEPEPKTSFPEGFFRFTPPEGVRTVENGDE
ncbi:Outer membrane lipoprotein carrier protein [uncultured Desulfatiglans sp.]|nr:Outer membrane lipoprotein carrier protein [uncultured Desulfatiglans sp.]